MIYNKIQSKQAEISYSRFEGQLSDEYNLMVAPTVKGPIDKQLEAIREALSDFMVQIDSNSDAIVFQRFFVSDFSNQSEILTKADLFGCNCAVSIIQQSPLNGQK